MRILEEYIEKYAGNCRVDFYRELTKHLQDGTYKLPKQIFEKLLQHPSVRPYGLSGERTTYVDGILYMGEGLKFTVKGE